MHRSMVCAPPRVPNSPIFPARLTLPGNRGLPDAERLVGANSAIRCEVARHGVVSWRRIRLRHGECRCSPVKGSRIAKRGDAVVVTVNQRLNILGFPDLSAIGGADYAVLAMPHAGHGRRA